MEIIRLKLVHIKGELRPLMFKSPIAVNIEKSHCFERSLKYVSPLFEIPPNPR